EDATGHGHDPRGLETARGEGDDDDGHCRDQDHMPASLARLEAAQHRRLARLAIAFVDHAHVESESRAVDRGGGGQEHEGCELGSLAAPGGFAARSSDRDLSRPRQAATESAGFSAGTQDELGALRNRRSIRQNGRFVMSLLRSTSRSLLSVTLLGGVAFGDGPTDEASGVDHAVAPIAGALEIGVGGGYAQSTGDIGARVPTLGDLSGPGGTVELKLGYRVTPNLAFGGYGTYGQYGTNDALPSGTVRSATAGAFAEWHFRPDRSIDPWVGLSSGWRGLWL